MIKRWAYALTTVGVLAASPALANRTTEHFTSLTVFGDSLVDAGNYYILTNQTEPDPALGYFDHRFTNGPDYPDLLSQALFQTSTTPSMAVGGGNNYGIAAARIIDIGDGIDDLDAQIGNYVQSGSAIDPNGLYILNFGANDVFAAKGDFDAFGGIGFYPDTAHYLEAAALQYVAGVQKLNDLGVRNILMTDFPLAGDPFTIEANHYLDMALTGLMLDPGTSLFFYSLSDFNLRVLTHPEDFNLPPQQLEPSCIEAGAQGTNCEGYFYFDGVHPTAAVQAAGFKDINARFGLTDAVPEPASWAMMIIGFGMVGTAMRNRRRSVRVAYA